jgi:HlyD family secretion protein
LEWKLTVKKTPRTYEIETFEPIEPIDSVNYTLAESKAESKSGSGWIWKTAGLLALLAATGAGAYWYVLPRVLEAAEPAAPIAIAPAAAPKEARSVAALGRLEPKGDITRLSSANGLEGARVNELSIQEGDRVRTGQVVAVLSTYQPRQAALLTARTQVQVAKARLEQVRAGAKSGTINAQRSLIAERQARIASAEATLQNAQTEYDRNSQLFASGAISASVLDTRRLTLETATRELERARQDAQREEDNLDSVKEVRSVDVDEASAQVQSAIAAVQEAEANLELSLVRAPLNGQVLKVHVRPGEVIGTSGIAEIAQTSQMYAVSEVYETDIGKVFQGQEATVTTDILPGVKMQGVVEKIGLKVLQQDAFSTSATAETDRKVIEVKVLLSDADSRKVASFTNLQVQVIFNK